MKVIDLLNKIANGEEIPNKFKFAHQIFEKDGSYYLDKDGDNLFESIFVDFSNINDEIEIIEEDNPIKKIARCDDVNMTHYGEVHKPNKNEEILRLGLNKVIDALNKMKEGNK